jgi:tetratricopeptide (TPR) repeat protein
MSDELERAKRELLAFARAVPPEAQATRARVLAAAGARRHGAVKWSLAALALLLIGGPALAQVMGVLPAVVERIASWTSVQPEPVRLAKRPLARAPLERVVEVTAPPAPVALPAPSAPPDAVALPASERLPSAASAARKVDRAISARAAREAGIERARALYLEAHRAHFEAGAPEAALRAWDAFLQHAPDDAFAPEARYNRAILLMKLARHAEALRALEPFACAAAGAYRQREASALITRLRALEPELPAPACAGARP